MPHGKEHLTPFGSFTLIAPSNLFQLEQGGWVVRDAISGKVVTPPATSEEAQQAVAEWNARCITRQVDPPVKVDAWGPPVSYGMAARRGWLVGSCRRQDRRAVDTRQRSSPVSPVQSHHLDDQHPS